MKNVSVIVAGDRPFYRMARAISALSLGAAYRLRAEGADHLPPTGAALLAVNHKNDLDPFFAGLAFRRPLRYFAKAELFGNRALRWTVSELGAIPVRRGEGDRVALENALACLGRGEALLIFPEGHRQSDEAIHTFQSGIGMLAARSGAPVIPVAVKGSNRLWHAHRPRFPVIRVKVGAPVDLSGLEGRKSVVYAEAAERVRVAVEELYGAI